MTPTLFRRHPRRGFTLAELVITIGIIVLAMAMAVPIYSSFAGTRSIDSAQNVASAMIQRARARAIGMQDHRGIFFFEDPATGRMSMTPVSVDETKTTIQIRLDPDFDAVEPLPVGVGAAFLAPTGANTPVYQPYGLILFDGLGRLEARACTFASPTDPTVTPAEQAAAAGLISRCGFTNYYPVPLFPSQTGLMLFDKTQFATAQNTGVATTNYNGVTLITGFGANQITWISQNAVALLVNRYNGTLIRGE